MSRKEGTYDELAEKAKAASDRFGEITEKQKALEARLVEIAVLKKHIINYSKTKDVYAEYRKSGYSKKFFEEHRKAITLCKAAKEALDSNSIIIEEEREVKSHLASDHFSFSFSYTYLITRE